MTDVSRDLGCHLRRLEQALAGNIPGREYEWARGVSDALHDLLEGLRLHAADTESRDGLMTEIDQTRPTLARQVNGLLQEHAHFLEQTVMLCEQVQNARRMFEPPPHRPEWPAPVPAIPDFGALRRRARQLLDGLRRHEERETDLVLESVTTDIGVGD